MGVFLVSCAMSVAIIGLLLTSKLAWRIAVDVPNDRSLHSRPIPRIGGWGVIPAAIAAAFFFGAADWPLAGLAMLLFVVSYLDDRIGLPILARLTTHAVVSVAWVMLGPSSLPLLMAGIVVIAIMWWINLYNFMDGANGLAGGMGLIGFLAYAVGAASHDMLPLTLWSLALAGASAGFLLFNFRSARVFLGDCGSVPLGFFVGALGLWSWSGGAWPAWFPFLVFASFFLDATVTLLRRMINGEPFWRAHAEHYYQRLIRSGWSHPRTALREYVLMAASASLATAMLTWSVSAQYVGLVIAAGAFIGLAIFVDRRWLQFQQAAGKASSGWSKLQYVFIPALLTGVAVIAVIPLRDASRYPYIIMEAPDGLRATFLHRGRPKAAQCEADVAKFVAAIQSKCAACKIVEKNCLDKLEPGQSQMLAAAPLDVPSVRLADGVVTFKSSNPNAALAVCRESERQASMGPRESFVECYSPGQVRKLL